MHTVNKYKTTLLNEFYIDKFGDIRRSKDGYYNRFKRGDLAKFFESSGGYLRIQVPKQRTTLIKSHLVLLLNGINLPDDKEVDHIDGNRQNDHISNLRIVNRQLNSCNRKKRSDNTSGICGIRWSDYHNHFVIRRTINGKRLSRSRKTFEEAKQVLEELKLLDTSYTVRHGK